jgi:hypothetical protein
MAMSQGPSGRRAGTIWTAVYWLFMGAFLLTAVLNLLHIKGGFLTNYLADLTLPALLYLLARELAPGKHLVFRSSTTSSTSRPTVSELAWSIRPTRSCYQDLPWDLEGRRPTNSLASRGPVVSWIERTGSCARGPLTSAGSED